MNFVAIDFETANEKRNSPCSIGIIVVKNGKIIEKIYHLIKPKEMRFMPINIGIHGIRPSMVKDELEFDKVWEKIKNYFKNSLVVAHNASFDVSVLRNSLELYNIEIPSFKYICTMKLSRNFYSNLENSKLNTVNNFLGYEFKHHDALADAAACGNILLNISKELNLKDINEISRLVGVTIGNVDKDGYKPSSAKGQVLRISKRENANQDKMENKRLNHDAFENKVVVFTGRLVSMTREEASNLVRKLSGIVGSSVTRKTTCVITNTRDIENLYIEEMSNKLKKTMELKKQGQNIDILNEEEFLKVCFN